MNVVKKGVILGVLGSVLVSGMAEAVVVKQSPLQSRYKDGRYDKNTVSTQLGYSNGLKTHDGIKVGTIRDNVKSDFYKISRESDTIKYRKASDTKLRNVFSGIGSNGVHYYRYMRVNYRVQSDFNKGKIISTKKLNNEFLMLLNAERRRVGVPTLKYGTRLQEGADARSQELANYGDIRVDGIKHVRLNKQPYYTAFTDKIKTAKYELGENLAGNFFYGNPYELVSEKHLARLFFNQWKNSPVHYQNMMSRYYKSNAISIKLASRNNYTKEMDMFVATQTLSLK